MSIEQPNPTPKPEEKTPEEIENQAEKFEITDTTSFREAIKQGELEQAEKWMREKYGTKKGYDDKWLEDRQRELVKTRQDIEKLLE